MKRRGNVLSPIDSINTVVEMLQQTDSSVEDGEIVWVRSTQCLWVYRVNSGLVPDSVNVVASLYGNGVWQRFSPALNALGQTAWFISESGLPTNTGRTASSPITEAERQARWGLITKYTADTTVTYLDQPSIAVQMHAQNGPEGANLTITGSTTQALTGTFSAVQVLNRGTQTPWAVTGVGLGAAHVTKIIRITSGARVGAYATVLKDLGAGKVMISPFVTTSLLTFQPCTTVTPQVNDPFEVLTFVQINVAAMSFRQGAQQFLGDGTGKNLVIYDLITCDGNFDEGYIESSATNVFFQRCRLNNMGVTGNYGVFVGAGGSYAGMFMVGGSFFFGWAMGFTFEAFTPGMFMAGSALSLDQDTTFEGSGLAVANTNSLGSGKVTLGLVGFFDNNTVDGALLVDTGCFALSANAGGLGDLIYGTGNLLHGVKVRSAGGLLYTTKPTVNAGLGAGRELLAGGVDTLWAAVPIAAMPANGATVQVRA